MNRRPKHWRTQAKFLLPRWSFSRNLGELTILTRASYAMLVFVPILAALWPSVRSVINWYNRNSVEQRARISASIERLELLDFGSDAGTIGNYLDKLRSQLAQLDQQTIELTISEPTIPIIWLEAYVAALFAALAGTLYQMFAPSDVKRFSMASYVFDQLRQYKDFESSAMLDRFRDQLASYGEKWDLGLITFEEYGRAQQLLHDEKKTIEFIADQWVNQHAREGEEKPEELHDEIDAAMAELKAIAGSEVTQERHNPRYTESLAAHVRAQAKSNLANAERELKQTRSEIVEAGAQYEYQRQAEHYPLARTATAIAYVLALVLIAIVLFKQVLLVFREAGF